MLLQVCELLLQRGANVNRQDRSGNTALHIASYQGHPATVILLLEWGAQILANIQGNTPLEVAEEEGEEEVVNILEEWSAQQEQVACRSISQWIELQYIIDQPNLCNIFKSIYKLFRLKFMQSMRKLQRATLVWQVLKSLYQLVPGMDTATLEDPCTHCLEGKEAHPFLNNGNYIVEKYVKDVSLLIKFDLLTLFNSFMTQPSKT